jgi:hypothetical protein
MNDAEAYVVSDGRFFFASRVQSRASSDDVWEVFWMLLLDHNGRTLWQIPQFNGPTMYEPNTQYLFLYETYYAANLYPEVVGLRMDCHC